VLSFDDAPVHAHTQARGGFLQVEGRLQPDPAPRFSRTPAAVPRRSPQLGEHTDALLTEAGLDAVALRQAGVVR